MASIQGTDPRLETLARRIDQWRRESGRKGARIPEEIWSSAVEIARERGLHATARALNFNYRNLKDRVQSAECKNDDVKGRHAFVELTSALPLEGQGKIVIELFAKSGHQMRIEVAGNLDPTGLAQTLWRQLQ